MSKLSESEQLIYELCIRFERKPRKCKKKNDSGIGCSERIVCIFNNTFYYFPKIQEFNDLDFDKLQYVVPKAGIALSQILQLKFPPRRNNERNYFSIIIPNNKICKYTKTLKELVIDQFGKGEQQWIFVFDYDIISLPQYEKRLEVVKLMEKQKLLKKKQKEEQEMMKRQQETKKKMEQQYDSLVQTEKLISEKQGELKGKQFQKQNQQIIEQRLQEADELYFHDAYQKLLKCSPSNQSQILECELDLLQAIGKFRKRAQIAVKKYIDELPFNTDPKIQTPFLTDNLMIKIGVEKHLNLDFLDSMKVAHTIYNLRKKIDNKIRVPLMALIKYKGFKILIRAVTPCDTEKIKEQNFLHGNYEQTWKTHFFLSDDLNIILEDMNLKPYNSEVQFQRISVHLGTRLKIISTSPDPFQSIKSLSQKNFSELTKENIIYAFNIGQVFPIDLDLQKNIKQDQVRLRPQFVQNYKQNGTQSTRLVGGALTYQFEDEEGARDDLTLAKASQHLKYTHLMNFVQDIDKLKYIPMNSEHLKTIMKQNGINMRYIAAIYKLTALPYIREIITVEAIAREIKKIYRDYQKDYTLQVFRRNYNDMINEAFGKNSMNSLRVIRTRQLNIKQKQTSIENAIDFLNLIFGQGGQNRSFWQIIKKKVKQSYKIQIAQHTDLSHGYLLTTVLYHCGFSIRLSSSLLLFSIREPFTIKDWIQFKCRTSCFTFPSLEVYKKCKITPDLTEEAIINRLQLSLYICRALGNDQSKILSQLSTYTRNEDIRMKQKFTVESLRYHVINASVQNFDTAYEICTFLLPSSHPFFQDLYLQYAALKTKSSITLKKAAENHAIRTLGINHWKTSTILSGFKEAAYIEHLIAAEKGVETNKKMQLFHKITEQQAKLGKYMDCFSYVQRAINFAQNVVHKQNQLLTMEEAQQYFRILMIGIQTTYKLRKIYDLFKISQYFWNALEIYRKNIESHKYIEHLVYYCMKGCLESSKKKYYIFKIVLVLQDKIQEQKQVKRSTDLTELRQKCRQSKNHLNWVIEVLEKLQFAYSQINDLPDFFTKFWQHAKNLASEQLDESLEDMELLVRIFGKQYFEEALLDRSYSFDKNDSWEILKPS